MNPCTFNVMQGACFTSATPTKFHGIWLNKFYLKSLRYLRQFNCNDGSRQLRTGEIEKDLEPARPALGSAAAIGSASRGEGARPCASQRSLGSRPVCRCRPDARSAEWTSAGRAHRHDYQRVINAYRNVYFGAPTSTKADPSAVAVAETLVEMGRRFDDDKILNEAIAQYKFLRKEYPGSKYRCDALFTIGEIYKDDLNDPEQARAVFTEFLHRYPHNRLVEDAQQAVAELDRQAAAEKKAEARSKSGERCNRQIGEEQREERRQK